MFSQTLDFLRDLRANNNREWFQAHKPRYESELVAPARQFILAMGPHLASLSTYLAEGTLFRIYRDVRFSSDKSPYKTHLGIQFRHEDGRDAHCPGYYFHLEPGECFAGAGMWRPEKEQLQAIRGAILERPSAWVAVKQGLSLGGDALKRPQKEWLGHPQQADLMRKDFVAMEKIDPAGDALASFQDFTRRSAALLKFLCQQTGHPF
ncbi:MAG: DUF2461 domain-containing protein [Vulcanimicrobiota bacterium]